MRLPRCLTRQDINNQIQECLRFLARELPGCGGQYQVKPLSKKIRSEIQGRFGNNPVGHPMGFSDI